jgi:hypothetical protein
MPNVNAPTRLADHAREHDIDLRAHDDALE